MTRRRLLILSALLLLPLVGIYLALQPPFEPGVTIQNFRRLHKGMTPEEVECILGTPSERRHMHSLEGEEIDGWLITWGCVEAHTTVRFWHNKAADGGFVKIAKNYVQQESLGEPPGLLERCRLWVKDWTGW